MPFNEEFLDLLTWSYRQGWIDCVRTASMIASPPESDIKEAIRSRFIEKGFVSLRAIEPEDHDPL